MTSKSSFWVDLKENNKRRVWLWVVSWLFFLLFYVAGCALTIVSARNEMPRDIDGVSLSGYEQLWMQSIMHEASDTWGGVLFAAAAVMAVVSALQGFSYLYHPKQMDFFHSQPVGKGRRFAVIWLNGLFVYLLPSLSGILGGILIAVLQGVMNGATMTGILLMYVKTLLLFLALYHLSIVAVMLTGHVMIALCAVGFLQYYEVLVRSLQSFYMEIFFEKYVAERHWNWQFMGQMWLSPYAVYTRVTLEPEVIRASFPGDACLLLLQGVLFGGAAFLLYRKRPAEAAGRAMAFPVTRPVVKLAVAIPVILTTALTVKQWTSGPWLYDAASGSVGFIAFTILVTAVIICGLMEVIYEFDIKACLRKKKHILISAGAAALIFLGFRFDVTGFDTYVPESEQVESYGMVFDTDFTRSRGYHDEQEGSMNAWTYADRHMFITDADAICRLAAIQPEQEWNTDGEYFDGVTVRYRLKGGRTEDRMVLLDYDNPETTELLNRIIGNPEYKKGAYFIMGDYFDRWLAGDENITVITAYVLGAYSSWIPEEATVRLAEAYRRDMEFIDYTDISEKLPVGYIQFIHDEPARSVRWSNEDTITQFHDVELYPDCTQTIACLKELGLYMEIPVWVEDIEQIEVRCKNELQDSMDRGIRFADGSVSATMVSRSEWTLASYTTPEEIAAIAQAIWPIRDKQMYAGQIDSRYEVTVYFKNGSEFFGHRADYRYEVLKGKLPLFAVEDTKYVPDASDGE